MIDLNYKFFRIEIDLFISSADVSLKMFLIFSCIFIHSHTTHCSLPVSVQKSVYVSFMSVSKLYRNEIALRYVITECNLFFILKI